MDYFRNLTIRGKIVSILALVLFLELVVCLSSAYFLTAINSRMSHIVDTDAAKIKLAGRLNSDLLEVHRAQKNLIMVGEKELVTRFTRHTIENATDLRDALASLTALADRDEREMLRSFKVSLEEFLETNSRIEAMVLRDWEVNGDPASPDFAGNTVNKSAVELSIGSGRAAYDRASATLSELVKRTDAALDESGARSHDYVRTALFIFLILSVLSIGSGLFFGWLTSRSIALSLNSLLSVTNSIADGHLDVPVKVESRDEIGALASSVSLMKDSLVRARDEASHRDWLKSGIARVNDVMRGRTDVADLCGHTLNEMAEYLGARVGALFLLDGEKAEPELDLVSGYAYSNGSSPPDRFRLGSGIIGQAALTGKQMVVTDIPPDYLKVCSSLGDSCPQSVTLSPIVFEGQVKGVVELGFLKPVSDLHLEYLEQVMPAVAINIETVRSREDLAKALARSQALYEELQRQQEELRATNEELEEQTERLDKSYEQLRRQQQDLEELNQELEEKNRSLEQQQKIVEQANRELEQASIDLEEKAEQLAIAGKYKSEFLANMSHELRTPLNSVLLLSRILSDNREGNLTEEQVRSAEIIHSSGNDLLSLINEVLDLSRIEAGRMEIHLEPIPVPELASTLLKGFKPFADEKGLDFDVIVHPECPDCFSSDRKRVDQILRNLVSNAIKFTEAGGVSVRFTRPRENLLAIAVRDTGIGIPADKTRVVFEAFQQLEGGTSRKYGGTGLGLSISRELAQLLGGSIQLTSEEGKGSTFTLLLPLQAREEACPVPAGKPAGASPPQGPATAYRPALPFAGPPPRLPDDRESLGDDDKVLLIVEDDPHFAEYLMGVCRKKGFKCLFAGSGEEGIMLAERHNPKGAILDLRLPGRDGWSVLEALKDNPVTRHIPVHIMSIEDAGMEAIKKGAVGFVTKPARPEEIEAALQKIESIFSKQARDLLVVEDDENLRTSIKTLIAGDDVRIDGASTAREAMEAMKTRRYDCMILDLGLPDMSGLEMLKRLSGQEEIPVPPVIVYTGRELSQEEEAELRDLVESIVVKVEKSEDRLFDEVSLFLHRVVEKMPEKKRKMITDLHDGNVVFRGKKILIVDDDMRNVFALSRILEEKGIVTLKAENGKKALDLLEEHPDIDLVLMDIMMPVMDGCEAMRRIRGMERFRKIPIIALTAKAMRVDRERCIEAGASDYLSKPVDVKRLFSLMRVWLYR